MATPLQALTYRYQLERRALSAFLSAQKAREKAAKLEAEAKALKALAKEKDVKPPPPAQPDQPLAGSEKSARQTKHDWPFSAALQSVGSFPRLWAETHKVHLETVRSWLKKKGHGGHKIPEKWAKVIAAEFLDDRGRSLVPAEDSSWPCGVRRN